LSFLGHAYYYGLIGETSVTVNDTVYTYSKLCVTRGKSLSEESILSVIGGFRNEGQKVFFKFFGYPEILLYDFGVEVGDIVRHNGWVVYPGSGGVYPGPAGGGYEFYGPSDDAYTTIYAIDTVNGRKRINYDWIEGVGGKGGFFGHIQMHAVGDEFRPTLNCFEYNDTVVYPTGCNTCPCYEMVGVENIENFNNNIGIDIFPNPTKDVLNINIPKDVNVKSITIYSVDGRLVEKDKYLLLSGQLNISKLKNGTYIIHIETEKGCFSKKVTKN
jgi:hypothetical protein